MHAWGEDGELAGQHGQLPGFRLAGDARHADDVTPADAGVQLPEAVLVTRVLSQVGYDLANGGRWWCGVGGVGMDMGMGSVLGGGLLGEEPGAQGATDSIPIWRRWVSVRLGAAQPCTAAKWCAIVRVIIVWFCVLLCVHSTVCQREKWRVPTYSVEL